MFERSIHGRSHLLPALTAATAVGIGYGLSVLVYLQWSRAELIDPGQLVYPLAWLVVSAAALATVVSGTNRRLGGRAVAVGVVYVLVIGTISGHIQLGVTGAGFSVTPTLPGWGPIVVAEVGLVRFVVVPFETIGYLTLGYLVARGIAVSSRTFAAGLLGLFSCAGCVLPILFAVGSAAGLTASTGLGTSYRVSTLVFVTSVLLLSIVVVQKGRCRV